MVSKNIIRNKKSKCQERVDKFTFNFSLGLPVVEVLDGRHYKMGNDGLFRMIDLDKITYRAYVYDKQVFARLLNIYEKKETW